MARGIQDIANNLGYVYMTELDGSTIIGIQPNTSTGVRNMRGTGTVLAPFAAKRAAYGILEVTTAAATGNVTSVTVNGVNQIGAAIPIASASNAAAAALIAAAINNFTPASGPDCVASVNGAFVYIFTPPSFGAASNGYVVDYSATGGALVATATAMAYGSGEGGVYDSVIGRRFFLNADYDLNGVSGGLPADPDNLTNAIEVTEYLVTRGFQTGVGTLEVTVATDALPTVERFCAITQLITTNQGGAATDSLEYINPSKFVEGDILFIRSTATTQILTVKDAANATVAATPNIYLTDANNFNIQSNKVLMLRYTFSNSLGGIFVEISRSVTGTGIVTLTRAQLITLIGSNLIDTGQQYYVTDVGAAGILITGASSNQVSSMGYLIAINPDYQNVSGDYGGTWYPTMGVPTINKLYAYNGIMYNSNTAAVGTAPDGDTTNWTAIALTDARYVREIDYIGYDLTNNFINYRKDKRGNEISQSYQNFATVGTSAIDVFQWGNDACIDNKVIASIVLASNQAFQFIGNTFINGSAWDSVTSTAAVVKNNVFNGTTSSGDTYTNFENNQLSFCALTANSGTSFTGNILNGSTISNNTTTDITNCYGYVCFTGNTGCTINLNSGNRNWTAGTINNLINANANCNISGNNFEMGAINANDGITITYNKLLNGYIQNNVNNNYPVLAASSCSIAQVEIKNEAKIDNIHWNTAGSIQRGTIQGNYGQIVNHLFDSTVVIAAVTATQTGLDTFSLDGLTIDGNNTALSFQSNTVAAFGSQYGYFEVGNNQSGAWGFLNMATAFAAGVLTIPVEISHAGVIYLYGCAGQNVTEIVVNANIKNLKKFPITFRWIQGAGTVTFTPNARPLAGNEFGSNAGAEVLTALGDSYTLEFIGGNFYKKYSSIIL